MAGAYSSAYSSAYDVGGGTTHERTGSSSIVVTTSATGEATHFATGSSSIVVTATGAGQIEGQHEGTGSVSIVVTTSGLGSVSGVEIPPLTQVSSQISVEVWSLPDDPVGFRLLCIPPFLDGTSFQDRFDVYGAGRLVIPSDYEHLGLIIDVDPVTLENSRSSLVRGFQSVISDESPGGAVRNCVWEFFADNVDEQIQSGQRVTVISGLDIRSAPDDAIVYPLSEEIPHWQWGQKSIIPNSGLEESGLTSAKFQLEINATAGTFTILITGISASPTAPIPWNTDLGTLQIAIENLDPGNVDVLITGVGTPENPFIIEFLNPSQEEVGTVSTDSSGLTGLASFFTLNVGGQSIIAPWTPSFHPGTGIQHGPAILSLSTERVHSGTYSLKIVGEHGDWPGAYPGAQVIQNVEAGPHWALIWANPENSGPYRFVIRTVDETFIAKAEATLIADIWQPMLIPALTIPNYVDQVIFRIASVTDSPGVTTWWVDDAVLAPGFPPTTWGDILGTLMNEAFTRGSLDWLELGFDAVVDSDGNAWDTAELEFTADALMQLGTHVIKDGETMDYEHDLIPLDPPVGAFTHQLQAFNPNGRGQTVAEHPAIILGSITGGRLAKRRMPYTHLLLELNDGTHLEMTDARLATFPRRERGARVEQANDQATALKVGQAIFDKEIANLLATQVNLDGDSVVPYRDFDIGWHVPYSLGTRAAKHDRRIHVIASGFSNDKWGYVVTASTLYAERDEQILENLRILNAEFLRKRKKKDGALFVPVGAGTFSVFSLPGQAFVEVGRLRLLFPLNAALIGVGMACNVAPTGAAIIGDVNKNGQSVFTDPGQRPTIPAGTNASVETFPTVSLINAGDYITVDIDQVGSTLPGGDVTFMVRWNWGVIGE